MVEYTDVISIILSINISFIYFSRYVYITLAYEGVMYVLLILISAFVSVVCGLLYAIRSDMVVEYVLINILYFRFVYRYYKFFKR